MRQVLLWRHAQAHDGSPDFQRSLTDVGLAQAATVGQWIASHGPDNLQVLSSPAVRAQQTASALIRVAALRIQTESALAPDRTWMQVRDLLEQRLGAEPLLLVGHQPWVGQVVAWLMTGQPQLWSVKKAALWWLVKRDRDTAWALRTVLSAEQLEQ
jgi:phosphohistidine phosphatase